MPRGETPEPEGLTIHEKVDILIDQMDDLDESLKEIRRQLDGRGATLREALDEVHAKVNGLLIWSKRGTK